MKKIWTRFKEWEYSFLALAFLIPLALMWLIFISIEVYPFGENSVLVLDLNGQYVYYFEALRDILTDGGSLLYTWSRALGGEFMGIFAYYLSSPFSLIVALFPKEMMTEALLTIILLKIGCCGAATGFYLHKSVRTSNTKAVIFSTLYALSAYVVVFGHNVMWLDAVIWLPIITYGLEQLIRKGKFKLFTVSLAMAMMANFYIGYMICIYVVLYFIYWYFAHNEDSENNFWNEKHHFVKSLSRTALYSVIAAAVAAWIILPTYYSLTFGKTTFSDPSYEFTQKFDFLELISKFLYGSYDTVRPEGLPQIYCGILTLLLTPLYFFAKKIKPREKIMSGVLVLVFILSFNGSLIDLFWHGMQHPNWLNYRYSFMLIFFMLVLASKALDAIGQIDFKWVTVIAFIWCVLIFTIQTLDYEHVDDLSTIWASLILIAIFVIILYSIKSGWLGHGAVLILAVVIIVETFTAGLLNVVALDEDVVISSRTSYVTYMEKYTPIIEEIQESDTSFYRMEKTNHRKTNDPFAFDFNGLSNSTSTLNAAQIELLNQLGYSSKSHWSKYLGGTPVSDSLLGLKYIIYDNDDVNDLYELYASDDVNGLDAYLNPYALSVAYATSGAICDLDFSAYQTPFELMNAMITAMLGESETVEVFKKVEFSEEDFENLERSYISGHAKYTPIDEEESSRVVYNLNLPSGTRLFCFFPSEYPREVNLSANGASKGTFFANETDRIVDLGEFVKDDVSVSLLLEDENLYISEKSDFYFAYIDEDVFMEALSRLQKGNLNINEHSDTRLYGTVNVGEGQNILFTTIPYDEGWNAYIDGEKAELIKTADSLLALEISTGEHTVEFKYMSDAFVYGCVITAVGVIAFAGAVVFERFRVKRRKLKWIEQNKMSS